MSDTHIKINAVTPRVQYTGNGVTTTFPYEFAIFDETDMVVYVGDDIIESGYTVTGAGETEGGTVVFDTAPDDGAKITLLRDVPIERVTDFQEGGTFRPKNLNDEFDRQTAFVQQVQEKIDRTLILPPTTEIDPSQVLAEVDRIYDSIDNVDAVADNETNVNAVADDLTNIDAVANDLSNVDTVAGIASDVSNVASNSSDVSNVATNISSVNTCAANMPYIIASPVSAGGNNTYTGTNTYKSEITSVADYAAGVNPADNVYSTYGVKDKNGVWLGGWEHIAQPDGTVRKSVVVRRTDGGNYAYLSIGITQDDKQFADATAGVKASITNWAMPDYTSLVTRSENVEYTETTNGFLIVSIINTSGDGVFAVTIGGISFNFSQGYIGSDYTHPCVGFIPIPAGVPYKITTISNTLSAVYAPCKGG